MHQRMKIEADRIKDAEKIEAKMQEKPQTANTMGARLK